MTRGRPHDDRRLEPGRLMPWQRGLVYGAGALMLVSGALWLLFHFALPVQTEFGLRPHPLEYQWLRLHGASAMLGLVALGSLLPTHIKRAWEARKNRAAGAVMLALVATLVASGYLLYYFASESSRDWISALHWGLGLAAAPALGWHVVAGRMLRRRRRPRSSETPQPAAPPPVEVEAPMNLH